MSYYVRQSGLAWTAWARISASLSAVILEWEAWPLAFMVSMLVPGIGKFEVSDEQERLLLCAWAYWKKTCVERAEAQHSTSPFSSALVMIDITWFLWLQPEDIFGVREVERELQVHFIDVVQHWKMSWLKMEIMLSSSVQHSPMSVLASHKAS